MDPKTYLDSSLKDVEGETLMKFEIIIKFSSSVYFNEYFQIKVKHVKWPGTYHIKGEDTSRSPRNN